MDTVDAYPVFPDAIGFVNEVIRLPNVVLGIRWTTRKCLEADTGEYKKANTDNMFDMLQAAGVDRMNGQAINFFIRAHYANRSRENLMDLYQKLNQTNPVTFTIYSDDLYFFKKKCTDDKPITPLNITAVRDAIMFFGAENVYLQVSDEVRSELHLIGLPNPRATTKTINSAPSIVTLNFYAFLGFVAVKFVEIFGFH